ncbi:MAG: septum formation initiator family protein [Lactobacillus sp.]
MQEPRIYNALSDEARVQRLLQKQKRHAKEVHRVRRNKIIAAFALIIALLVVQLSIKLLNTRQVNQQAEVARVKASSLHKTNNTLKGKVADLNDPNYLAKLVRYKYYYSKPGETIYNVPEKAGDDQ